MKCNSRDNYFITLLLILFSGIHLTLNAQLIKEPVPNPSKADLRIDKIYLKAGESAELTINLDRGPSINGVVSGSFANQPQSLPFGPSFGAPLKVGQTSVTAQVTVPLDTPSGDYTLNFVSVSAPFSTVKLTCVPLTIHVEALPPPPVPLLPTTALVDLRPTQKEYIRSQAQPFCPRFSRNTILFIKRRYRTSKTLLCSRIFTATTSQL
jgi:hypothetical protein